MGRASGGGGRGGRSGGGGGSLRDEGNRLVGEFQELKSKYESLGKSLTNVEKQWDEVMKSGLKGTELEKSLRKAVASGVNQRAKTRQELQAKGARILKIKKDLGIK